jgi:hypothetical protein
MTNQIIIQTLVVIAIMNRRTRANKIMALIHERAVYARLVDSINGEEIDRNAKVVSE